MYLRPIVGPFAPLTSFQNLAQGGTHIAKVIQDLVEEFNTGQISLDSSSDVLMLRVSKAVEDILFDQLSRNLILAYLIRIRATDLFVSHDELDYHSTTSIARAEVNAMLTAANISALIAVLVGERIFLEGLFELVANEDDFQTKAYHVLDGLSYLFSSVGYLSKAA